MKKSKMCSDDSQLRRGEIEKVFYAQGRTLVGVDEVGRGCLAGPVYAAAVILNYEKLVALPETQLKLLRDSKTLSTKQRQSVLTLIKSLSVDWAVASAAVATIESEGIVTATFMAMQAACELLSTPFDLLLIDGNQKNPLLSVEQLAIVGGDMSCFAIAAASILAKEARDDFMRKLAHDYPDFEFDRHVGYGTKSHMEKIAKYGITPWHRRNFAPIRQRLELM